MSYVEKAFWDYLKSQIFGGIRILFSRRLILFSVILFVISAMTTMTVVFQDQELITDELRNYVFIIQISIAIGMIICGLVSKKLSILIRFLLLIAIVIIIQGIYIISQNATRELISELLIEYFPLFAFFSWAFLVPLASFAFSKGMFSNKITGSVLFLGKPKTERKSIFSGIFALIALISFLWNLTMIYTGLTEDKMSYIVLGTIGAIVAFTIILVTLYIDN